MTYQPGVPTGSIPLNQDYLNIQGNFTSLNTQFNVDHVPLTSTSGNPPNGYHTSIHLVPASFIANASGYGQLYNNTNNDGYSNDQSLYFNTGTGNLTLQLTNNFVPTKGASVGDSGRTFLPGGITLIWGSFDPNSSTTVTFPFSGFPNVCVNVQLTGSASNNSTFRNNISTGTISKTGFTWQGTVDSHYKPIFYLAIGN